MAQPQTQHTRRRHRRRDDQLSEIRNSNLHCSYLPLDRHAQRRGAEQQNLLGTIVFSAEAACAAGGASASPFVQVRLPSLRAGAFPDAACELWHAESDLRRGSRDGVAYACSDELLFGAVQASEEETGLPAEAGKTPLQRASESAYRRIFGLLDALGFPHVLRFWNYIADINGDSHGLERYRQFNIGRQDAFLGSGRQIAGGAVPAASAVGCYEGPLTVYFFAGRSSAPIAIENPRQISAYRYPAEYGPRSPTFSRASIARVGGCDLLFISGTASIVGHRTLHAGDAAAQTRESLANIDALVTEARRLAPDAGFSLQQLCYKVYVRHAHDTAAIGSELRRILGPSARALFLRADICRADLLVEIEATAGHPLEFAL